MRVRPLLLALTLLISVAACDGGQGVTAEATPPIPTTVACGSGAELRQHVTDDRRRIAASRSDHERISVGSRANFLASLAVIADLKCKVALAEADDTLKPALEAARKAQSNASVYEQVRGFHEADFLARRAVDLLIARIDAPAAK